MHSLSNLTLEGGGWRVAFERRGDRLAHRIAAERDGTWIDLLESVEGTADEDWPPSPPLQELHTESRADARQVALLVGMAGSSHWSLSVELLFERRELVFDTACRVRAAPAWLGSVYRVCVADGQAERRREGETERRRDRGMESGVDGTLVFGGGAGAWRMTAEAPSRLDVAGGEFRIGPPLSADVPCTARWTYRLRSAAT
jgi:hypothetical protein